MPRLPLRSAILRLLLGACGVVALPAAALITYDNRPAGTPANPLVLRTYLPDPDIDAAVFAHHDRGFATPEYSPEKGQDITGEVVPLKGVPAAIAVNFGSALSYAFDSTEGRLLYAWQGGFLDMYPYWGDRGLGTRLYDYNPRLIGTLFYKAVGAHPLEIDGRSVSELGAPDFIGYDLVNREPVFIVRHGQYTVRTHLRPASEPLGLQLSVSVEPAARLSYRNEDSRYTVAQQAAGTGRLEVSLTGGALGSYEGYVKKLEAGVATAAGGAQIAKNYSCTVCHSTDGSMSHGPTWAGLYGHDVTLVDGTTVKADDAYLLESIKEPNARVPKGFAPNFMPPYPMLQKVEYDSIILYIKSLAHPE